MSTTVTEEKTKAEMVIQALTDTEAAVVLFLVIFITGAVLLYLGKIDASAFRDMFLSDALISMILKLLGKKE